MIHTILALTLLASSTSAVWSQPQYEPIAAEAYSEDLQMAGFRNGYMPDVRLITVSGCTLERDAAYTLAVMIDAAAQDGVDLDPGDCYRSYGVQHNAFEARCPIETIEITKIDPTTGDTIVVGERQERVCSGPPIAPAGSSNHGWGRAIDFTSNGRSTIDCNDEEFRWLQANGERFGWVHPGWAHCGRRSAEPWHWEWGGVQDSLPLPPVVVSTKSLLHRVR
jgi:hypothetical protein